MSDESSDITNVNSSNMTVDENGNLAMFSPEGFGPEELQQILSGSQSMEEAMAKLGFENPDVRYDFDHTDRVANTVQMMQITAKATRLNLNRRLNFDPFKNFGGDWSRRLMSNSVHVLQPILVHTYAQGQPVEPHMRVMGFLRLKGGIVTRPDQRILDIPMDTWERLPYAVLTRETKDALAYAHAWREQQETVRQRMAGHE